MPTERPSIIVTRRLPRAVERELTARFAARLNADDRQFSPAELIAALQTADALLCTLTDRLDAAVLRSGPFRTRLLANFGAGTDHLDLAAARAAGLAVTNTPGVLTDDTADGVREKFAGKGYGAFKSALAEVVVDALEPIQSRIRELEAAPEIMDGILTRGASLARQLAAPKMALVRERMGIGGVS